MTGLDIDYEGLRNALQAKLGAGLGDAMRRAMSQRGADEPIALLILAHENGIEVPKHEKEGEETKFRTIEEIQAKPLSPDASVWTDTIGIVTEVEEPKLYPKANTDINSEDVMQKFALKGMGPKAFLPVVVWKREAVGNLAAQAGGLKHGRVYRFFGCKVRFDERRGYNTMDFYKSSEVEEATFDDLYGAVASAPAVAASAAPASAAPASAAPASAAPAPAPAAAPAAKPRGRAKASAAAPAASAASVAPAPTAAHVPAPVAAPAALARERGIVMSLADKAKDGFIAAHISKVAKAMDIEEERMRTAIAELLIEGDIEEFTDATGQQRYKRTA